MVAAAGGGIGAAAAAAAGICCGGPVVAPAVVSILGASGAVRVAGLEPYSPYLLLGSLPLLVYALGMVRRRRRLCTQGTCRPTPRWVRVMVWMASTVWVLSAAVNVAAHVVS